MEKLTLNDLINRKAQMKSEIRTVDVPVLGGSIVVQKLPIARFLGILDRYTDANPSIATRLEMCVDIIYNSVPMFQKSELQEAYDCVEPTDIVVKLFDDDIQAIGKLADEISGFYGISNELKN